ncbi:protein SIEVE ELEMENT OCCLUSION B-like [Corylus avellana]|uniref:protein SIEVE ELEMENT OCCLUSION B-like n=1 Tax=Corylus avellana TaxID=13451 RepID=UPI00286A0895|nr:protein SIEVE ELEMENT OCCLUSION B-like [Corylus avellana]
MWDRPFCYDSHMRLISQISATHGHVPADENIDADSLFVDIKNDLKHIIHTVDNALLGGQEHPENLELNVSKDSFDPLLCRLGLRQLSSEMACKALCAETAHKRTILILNKLSSYSWEAKAVLALAAFALNYKYFSVPAQLHSSRQVEIPKHVPATLKHLDLPKCKETISELNTMINDVLDFSESVFELKKLSTNNYIEDKPCSYILGRISFCVYGIIISVVACTTQMCCLTSDE